MYYSDFINYCYSFGVTNPRMIKMAHYIINKSQHTKQAGWYDNLIKAVGNDKDIANAIIGGGAGLGLGYLGSGGDINKGILGGLVGGGIGYNWGQNIGEGWKKIFPEKKPEDTGKDYRDAERKVKEYKSYLGEHMATKDPNKIIKYTPFINPVKTIKSLLYHINANNNYTYYGNELLKRFHKLDEKDLVRNIAKGDVDLTTGKGLPEGIPSINYIKGYLGK